MDSDLKSVLEAPLNGPRERDNLQGEGSPSGPCSFCLIPLALLVAGLVCRAMFQGLDAAVNYACGISVSWIFQAYEEVGPNLGSHTDILRLRRRPLGSETM